MNINDICLEIILEWFDRNGNILLLPLPAPRVIPVKHDWWITLVS